MANNKAPIIINTIANKLTSVSCPVTASTIEKLLVTWLIINIAKYTAINLINRSKYVFIHSFVHLLNVSVPFFGSILAIIGIGATILKKPNLTLLIAISKQKLINNNNSTIPAIVEMTNVYLNT